MTNYDTLKEYEAHKEPLPSYDEYKRLVSNSDESSRKALQLEKKLEIAKKALDHCQGFDFVQYALKEMEGVK